MAPLALPLHVATLAWAVSGDDGEQPGAPLPLGMALLIYVGAPLAIAALIALLVFLPSLARGPRYRPGREWTAEPVWVNGPAEGASAAAPSGQGGGEVGEEPARRPAEGGTSARW